MKSTYHEKILLERQKRNHNLGFWGFFFYFHFSFLFIVPLSLDFAQNKCDKTFSLCVICVKAFMSDLASHFCD